MNRLIIALLFLFSISAFGNNLSLAKNIKGIVIDAETKQPLEFATVSIYKNETLIDGIITNEKGGFSISVPNGNYALKIEYLSYTTFETDIELKQHIDLGIIPLNLDMETLNAVEIIAKKSVMEFKLDKKVFNVGKDLISQNGSLSQVLNNVPSVSVAIDGTVNLRGNPNVTILINGKPSVLTSQNNLDQIQSQNIERIEVITNPSSRYQASGTGGIINVVLKKNKTEGFSGSFTVQAGTPKDYNFSTSLNYKVKKLNLFSTIGYKNSDYKREQTANQDIINNNATTILMLDAYKNSNDEIPNIYIGGDYSFNERNSVTMSFYHDVLKNTDESKALYNYLDESQTIDSTIVRTEHYYEPQDYNQFELSYLKTFNKEGKKLMIDFQYDFWDDDELENLFTQKIVPVETTPDLLRTRNIESSNDYLIQLHYESPITTKSKFESGFRAESRVISSDYTAEEYVNNQWQIFNNIENNVDYHEKIGGVFGQFAHTLDKLSFQIGLRAEFTEIKIKDTEGEFNNSKKYNQFFPTSYLNYAFTDGSNLQLSYSRRINRPGFWQLNPFAGLSDFSAIRIGNPDLNPALSNVLELGLLTRLDKITINPSVYYNYTSNAFDFSVTKNNEAIIITKPINLDFEERIGFELSANYTPYKWLNVSGEFNYFTFEKSCNTETQNFDFRDSRWFTKLNAQLNFPKDVSVQTNFSYYAPNESLQTRIAANYNLDIALSKRFLKNKMQVTFNAQNVFDSRIEKWTTTGENFFYKGQRKRYGTRLNIALLYRFNKNITSKSRTRGSSNR
ncbi:outer membrane beta-barrel family protein [Flavivirga rizhaonensis]|uniref:TonB-dependent receptor n=1 Tax=Flavivirga rizhaonensis TaxID=2559571 RepID=A0A4S1E3U2_9FLAO|nr:outer membrane beta-barrel family protein [Flavivirga rizhaonensis]TGV04728.1 TonB-dependent receptor [Flavivirga rizhaonensis]